MSAGVGPNVDCSRKRTVAASVSAGPLRTASNFEVEEIISPGLGFCTVTGILPLAVALPVAVNCVAEINVVVSAVFPNITAAPFTKLFPVTSMLNEPRPMVVGLMAATTGTGFSRVMVLVPERVGFAVMVPATVTVLGFGSVAGD